TTGWAGPTPLSTSWARQRSRSWSYPWKASSGVTRAGPCAPRQREAPRTVGVEAIWGDVYRDSRSGCWLLGLASRPMGAREWVSLPQPSISIATGTLAPRLIPPPRREARAENAGRPPG